MNPVDLHAASQKVIAFTRGTGMRWFKHKRFLTTDIYPIRKQRGSHCICCRFHRTTSCSGKPL
jgi:hypothetical protein